MSEAILDVPATVSKFAEVGDYPSRLSVSAIRDYMTCPQYYKYKRVDRLPERATHHMAAGSLIHASFYLAYALPVGLVNRGSFDKEIWQVHGDFTPERSLQLLDAVWWSDDDDTLSKVPADLHDEFMLLRKTLATPKNFSTGQKKMLKAKSQSDLRSGWYEHYYDMLEKSLEHPLPHPVVDIEREIHYKIGSIDAVGYIDVVMQKEPEREIFLDLKSGYNRPNDQELFFDEQMAAYYTTGPEDIWYYHMRSGEMIGIDPNFALQNAYGEIADATAEAIAAGYYPKRFSKDCVRCPFRVQCLGV